MAEGRSSDVVSVVAVLAGLALALGLAFAAVGASLCSLFGEQCTSAEQRQIQLLAAASIGVFLIVPAAVAIVRRQARWLLAPVIEAALIVGIVVAVDVF